MDRAHQFLQRDRDTVHCLLQCVCRCTLRVEQTPQIETMKSLQSGQKPLDGWGLIAAVEWRCGRGVGDEICSTRVSHQRNQQKVT